MSGVVRRVTISGRVQGVGYRAWLEGQATSRGLEGWVRNRRDNSVEAVFSGSEGVIADMIASCQRGPVAARVDAVQVETASLDVLNLRRAGERFSFLPTI